ncbi:MAG: hypothetical protein IPJ21_20225 [Sterolibacteriaceae bacterium]|nr:hypothetical protein [Sterolibacteriaceae bacterium]
MSKLEAALNKASEPETSKCPNVVVLPGGNGYEAQLLAEGYLAEIESAIDEAEGQDKYLRWLHDYSRRQTEEKGNHSRLQERGRA